MRVGEDKTNFSPIGFSRDSLAINPETGYKIKNIKYSSSQRRAVLSKMKNKILKGVSLGAIAGVIDVILMVIQKLSWDANLSAFAHWVVAGFVISISNLRLRGWLKGLLISILLLIPVAILIGWKEPISLIPIGIMTIILGSALGYLIEK